MKNNPIFKRTIEDQIIRSIGNGKVIMVFGPRQVGKTTLAKRILALHGLEENYFNCEQMSVRDHLVVGDPDRLKSFLGTRRLVVLDEAQTVENIGAILKVFTDTYPQVQIIATGSSSFDLANKINEPLTGRAISFTLLPLSVEEIESVRPIEKAELHHLMQYGSYPEIVVAELVEDKERLLRNIATSYLYKDIFMFERIKSPTHFEQLLKLLAHQIGSMVSMSELAEAVGVSRQTIEKYIRLLEQSYVIRRVHSFSRNKRNELRRSFKIFFLDAGIRNAIIQDVRVPLKRPDVGALFEQFVFTELMKRLNILTFAPDIAFWRTKQGLEIDFVLEHQGDVHAYECKWGDSAVSFGRFLKLYPNARTEVIRPKDMTTGRRVWAEHDVR